MLAIRAENGCSGQTAPRESKGREKAMALSPAARAALDQFRAKQAATGAAPGGLDEETALQGAEEAAPWETPAERAPGLSGAVMIKGLFRPEQPKTLKE